MKSTIDTQAPGGNAIIEKVEELDDVFHVHLRPDLRDTEGEWFWWSIRLAGLKDQKVALHFTREHCTTTPGVVKSTNGGKDWELHPNTTDRRVDLEVSHEEVFVAMAVPYLPKDWSAFLARCPSTPEVRLQQLTTSKRGRPVPALEIGDTGPAVTLTCRHHACESLAS